ncbi:unnamed protein product, partial [Rotaria sp. Silwood1]
VTPTKDLPVLHGRTIKPERLHPLSIIFFKLVFCSYDRKIAFE